MAGDGRLSLTRTPTLSLTSTLRDPNPTATPTYQTEPEAWFAAADVAGDGRLSRAEAVGALLSQLPLDVERFDARIDQAGH